MNPLPELVTAVQMDRERSITRDRLASLAARVRACCGPTLVDRIARALPAGAERALASLR